MSTDMCSFLLSFIKQLLSFSSQFYSIKIDIEVNSSLPNRSRLVHKFELLHSRLLRLYDGFLPYLSSCCISSELYSSLTSLHNDFISLSSELSSIKTYNPVNEYILLSSLDVINRLMVLLDTGLSKFSSSIC